MAQIYTRQNGGPTSCFVLFVFGFVHVYACRRKDVDRKCNYSLVRAVLKLGMIHHKLDLLKSHKSVDYKAQIFSL